MYISYGGHTDGTDPSGNLNREGLCLHPYSYCGFRVRMHFSAKVDVFVFVWEQRVAVTWRGGEECRRRAGNWFELITETLAGGAKGRIGE
ncbi:hypothetical protein BaRGS_00004792 [Batillaria attramentaria]|uniref:Uncharacterized protein n=1 Tax=Batillaria attramentaria TaxID=370345 RepID=A0ABD0LY15_9CAEN